MRSSSTVDEVQKALERCKEQLTKPGMDFDLNHCTREQRWLVTKAEEALRTLREIYIEKTDEAWLSIDLIAVEGGSKSMYSGSYMFLSIL